MAAAYATFAAGGLYAAPYSIDSVRNPEGDVVYEHQRRTRHVFEAAQVRVLNRALEGVVTRGTGRAARLGRPVAGKTGTTQDNVDAWFVGYVPQLSTAVWVGYEPRAPMTNVHGRPVTGGGFPAAIFSDLMRQALKGVPAKEIRTAAPEDLGLSRLDPDATAPTAPAAPTTGPEPRTTGPS
jgi:penicillin-binding protein 1A